MDVREKQSSEKQLINREALLSFEKMDAELCATCGEHHTAEDVIMMIKTAPTVDAVEVLRCRDCKYWGDEAGKLQHSDGVLFARCKVHNYLIDGRHTGWCPTENDFCSYGERKDGVD